LHPYLPRWLSRSYRHRLVLAHTSTVPPFCPL
jgi:hypothetical protein